MTHNARTRSPGNCAFPIIIPPRKLTTYIQRTDDPGDRKANEKGITNLLVVSVRTGRCRVTLCSKGTQVEEYPVPFKATVRTPTVASGRGYSGIVALRPLRSKVGQPSKLRGQEGLQPHLFEARQVPAWSLRTISKIHRCTLRRRFADIEG